MDLWISPKYYLVVVGWQINHPFKWSFHALLSLGSLHSTYFILILSVIDFFFFFILIFGYLYIKGFYSAHLRVKWHLKKSLPLSVSDESIKLFQSLLKIYHQIFLYHKENKSLFGWPNQACIYAYVPPSLALFDLLWITTEDTCIDRTIINKIKSENPS